MTGDDELAPALLDVVRKTFHDLHPELKRRISITLDSSLDRDLGFDSLARVELVLRVEKTFNAHLPENTLAVAETPRDLLAALLSASNIVAPAPLAVARAAPAQPVQGVPAEATTLLEVLDWHVRRQPNRVQIIVSSDQVMEEISYAKLRQEAAAVAAGLQRHGLESKQTVAIMLPTSPDYFYTYFGILLAGGIPVPIYPPARLSQIEEHVRRHAGILSNAQAATLVTVPEAMPVARLLEANVPGLHRVVTVPELSKQRSEASQVRVEGHDLAFIQYTSGSTGNPKGVVLTHDNLLANIRAIGEALEVTANDVFVSWLPLYHDMGLISAWLTSLYFGNPLVVMSPLAFLARPERWLWAIHKYRGTLTAAPNFAFELCWKRIEDQQIEGLDLSSVRMMANGAEPVSPDTIARFTERFAKYGFHPEAMTPVYGLAEATVGLLCPPIGRGPVIDRIRREPFVRQRKALPAAPDEPNPLRFVGCGRPLPGMQIRIVDEAGVEVGERIEGRLEFKGPSVTSGYYRNPEQTRRLFDDEWLDTGDRAYIADGDIYLTGRVKDIIIRGGRNLYPHEIEEAVGSLAGVRKGCVAAFGSPDPESGTERLVILAETRETDVTAQEALREAITRATADVLGEPPDEVVLAPPHTVLKTSSGKIRRAASRELYEAGLVYAGARAVWWQVARLGWSALGSQLRRWRVVMARSLYGAYTWALFWLMAPLTWLVTAAIPRPTWAWAVNHGVARLLLKLCAMPLVLRGAENLSRGTPCVLVANHASYLDGMALLAALPRHFGFIAKREFLGQMIPRVYLRNLGAQFVERFAVQQSVDDADRLARAASTGRSLLFFAEGTFRRMSGLLPFHLGAFIVAAKARVPVVPAAIRGTRAILPDGRWLPRHGAILVTIGSPITPPADVADTFAAAVYLRDAARAEILQDCGEGDAGRGA
jgi:1-acyl-sn-glycerol-3-phosphate acyltransferase